jgi:hypothetical protein
MTTTSTPTISPVKQIEAMYQRLEKARSIYAAGKVHRILGLDQQYVVQSSTGDGFYQVNGVCTCQDAQHRTELHHGWCCHKLAVELFKEQQAIAETPKVANTINKADTTPAETERSLEDQLEDLYPKARSTDSLR